MDESHEALYPFAWGTILSKAHAASSQLEQPHPHPLHCIGVQHSSLKKSGRVPTSAPRGKKRGEPNCLECATVLDYILGGLRGAPHGIETRNDR
jgi:hypothetical protein